MSRIPILKSSIPRLSGRSVPLLPKQQAEHTKDQRHHAWSRAVRERAGWKCEKCGARGVRLFADHIKEIQDGGKPFDLTNGQALCGSCHTTKTVIERSKRAFGQM